MKKGIVLMVMDGNGEFSSDVRMGRILYGDKSLNLAEAFYFRFTAPDTFAVGEIVEAEQGVIKKIAGSPIFDLLNDDDVYGIITLYAARILSYEKSFASLVHLKELNGLMTAIGNAYAEAYGKKGKRRAKIADKSRCL